MEREKPRLSRRHVGRRVASIVLIAVMSVGLFQVALADGYWSTEFVDVLLKEYPQVESLVDTFKLSGSVIGKSATDQGITVTIDSAYSEAGRSTLALAFSDEQNRLDKGIQWWDRLSYGPRFQWRTHSSSIFAPIMVGDKVQAIMTVYDHLVEGEDARLTIDSITPSSTSVYNQPTGLTLDEVIGKSVPGAPEATFSKVEMVKGGLLISVLCEYQTGFNFQGIALKGPDGTLIENEAGTLNHAVDRPENPDDVEADENGHVINATLDEAMSAFPQVKDYDAVKDYEVLVAYTRQAEEIKGKWEILFHMPEGLSDEGAVVELEEKFTVNKDQYHVTDATIYPSYIMVSYNVIEYHDENELPITDEAFMFHYDDPKPQVDFTLLDENGKEIPSSVDLQYMGTIDSNTGERLTYDDELPDRDPYESLVIAQRTDALIDYDTEQYNHITLQMFTTDGNGNDTVYFTKQIK